MKSFYLMLATVGLMICVGITLAALAVAKYVTYKPSDPKAVSVVLPVNGTPQVSVSRVGDISVAEADVNGSGNFDYTHTAVAPVQKQVAADAAFAVSMASDSHAQDSGAAGEVSLSRSY